MRPALHEAAGYALGLARAALLLHDPGVVSSHRSWLDTFVGSRGLGLAGDELLEAVDDAGARVLEDPCRLHAVIAG